MIILRRKPGRRRPRRAIKKRGNSWWVVVYTGRDPLTGKKRQKTGTAKNTCGTGEVGGAG
jgi:hypothetical protein